MLPRREDRDADLVTAPHQVVQHLLEDPLAFVRSGTEHHSDSKLSVLAALGAPAEHVLVDANRKLSHALVGCVSLDPRLEPSGGRHHLINDRVRVLYLRPTRAVLEIELVSLDEVEDRNSFQAGVREGCQ